MPWVWNCHIPRSIHWSCALCSCNILAYVVLILLIVVLSPSYISYFNLNTTFSTFFSALYKCNHWWRYDLYQNIWYYCKKTVALFETWFRTLAYSSIVPLLIYIYISKYIYIYIYIIYLSFYLFIYCWQIKHFLSKLYLEILRWNFAWIGDWYKNFLVKN